MARSRSWYGIGPSVPVLALAALILAYGSRLPTVPALALAVVGVGAGVSLRRITPSAGRELAPIPVLIVLGTLAAATPIVPVAELLAGLSGVAFLVWLADDPSRPSGGIGRGFLGWALPGLAVVLAWGSSFLLPARAAPFGVAGALLAGALIAIAYLVGRPDLLDRDGAPTI